jgi:hypothetical protein
MQRRRPFALLRAAGVYLSELQSVIMLETMLPLTATTAIGVALGHATSAAVSSSTGERWAGLDFGFFVTVLIRLLTTVAVSGMALPLVRTMTEHDAVRFD